MCRSKLSLHVVLFIAVLLIGIFARTWEFGSLPPGVNQDEASNGVDAFSLYHYGIDRNGVSFPVFMISWGGGQNALNVYAMIPFIAVGGLSPFTVRLPALISGILTLPLVYFIGRRTINEKFGLAAMFLLAISPWHILISRWGFEGNLLPFIFSLAYLLVLKSTDDGKWFIPAMLFMGLCLYAYGPAYAGVPLFLLGALAILIRTHKASWKYLILGLIVLGIVGAPIALFVLINALHLDTIQLGPITIPRLLALPRWETVSAAREGGLLPNLTQGVERFVRLLWVQEDGFIVNTVPPYGYFYTYTLPLAVLGAVLLIPFRGTNKLVERWLLGAWLIAAILVGVLQEANINRVNLIFIPLLFCIAAVLVWIAEHTKIGLVIAVSTFLIAFAFFTRAYHGPEYRATMDNEFASGLTQAVDFAARQGDNPICIPKIVHQSYIYVLFSQQLNPADYLPTIKYNNPRAIARQVLHLGRYSFGAKQCPDDTRTIYIISSEAPPQNGVVYNAQTFGNFTVYVPNTNSQ